MNIKKIFTLLLVTLFVLLSACGYQPIFSKKQLNFNIKSITFSSGDVRINKTLNQKLRRYINSENNNIYYDLIINSNKLINVTSRDSKGKAQTYRAEITVNIIATNNKNQIINKEFKLSNNYNSESNSTRLKEIENKITNNLSTIISDQIILALMNK
tara:strand:+ start:30 stop:500 length:471 start_codon:yes stop_codon:yes gene_type:complete